MPEPIHPALFAATAIKLGLVSADEISWAIRSERSASAAAAPLAEILVRWGVLNPQERIVVEAEVQRELSATSQQQQEPTRVSGSPRPVDTAQTDAEMFVSLEEKDRYSQQKLHARGGQGLIFRAMDRKIGREVAIKEFLPGRAPGSTPMIRFLREARVTGQLEHPNIVPVHELNRRPDGTLYYTMRFVHGKTMSQRLAECHSLQDRMRLIGAFWDVCNAIAFAHSKGVVHRDIKPDNAMVGEFGETVVVDWGIAKVQGEPDVRADELERELQQIIQGSAMTAVGTAVGTPAYMSPEQARGEIEGIDERSDVWGLGAVLYEILTGRPPFDGPVYLDVLRQVIEDPVPPVRGLCPEVPPELAAVAEKALRKDKEKRYQSARELAQEVSAFMTGARVGAYEYTSLELLRRFAAKNKPVLVASALVLATILVSLILVSLALRSESVAREREHRERQVANFHLAQGYADRAEQKSKARNYPVARIFAAAALVHNPANPKSPFHGETFGDQMPESTDLLLRSMSQVDALNFHHSVTLVRTLTSSDALIKSDFSPDGRWLAAGSYNNTAWIWEVEGDRRLLLRGHTNRVYDVDYSPDGTLLATCGRDANVILWDPRDGRQLKTLSGHAGPVRDVEFFPDGRTLASSGDEGKVRIWDVATGQLTLELTGSGRFFGLIISPDGRTLAAASADRSVQIWDIRSGEHHRLEGHGDELRCVAFSPDGKLLASSGNDAVVRLWNVESRETIATLTGHTSRVMSLAFSPNGRWLATGSLDYTTRLWDLQTRRPLLILEGNDFVYWLSFDSNGRLSVLNLENVVRVYRLVEPQKTMLSLEGHGSKIADFALSAQGTLVSGSWDRKAMLWDLQTGRRLQTIEHDTDVNSVSITKDGGLLAFASSKAKTIQLWDLRENKLRRVLAGHADNIYSVLFSPDESRLASAGIDGSLKLWDVADGSCLRTIQAHEGQANWMSFSPGGEMLATSGNDRVTKLWDVQSGRLVRTLAGHGDWVSDSCFSPDGRTIATAGKDGVAILWDVATGKEIRRFVGHRKWVNRVRFTPDGRHLATSSDDGTARIWSVADGRTLLLFEASDIVSPILFTPDGKRLITEDSTTIQIYPLELDDLAVEPSALLDASQGAMGVELRGFRLVDSRSTGSPGSSGPVP